MKTLIPIITLTLLLAAPGLVQACDGDGPHGKAAFTAQAGWGGGPGLRGDGPRGDGPRHDGPPRKMVEAFRLYKLTEYLELSEKQTEKFYPRMAEIQNSHEQHREQMREKMKALRELIDDEKNGEAAKLAAEIHDLRGKFHQVQHAKQGELMKLLDEEQQAKFVLFERRFEHHLQEMAQRFQGRRGDEGGERGKRRPGARGR